MSFLNKTSEDIPRNNCKCGCHEYSHRNSARQKKRWGMTLFPYRGFCPDCYLMHGISLRQFTKWKEQKFDYFTPANMKKRELAVIEYDKARGACAECHHVHSGKCTYGL